MSYQLKISDRAEEHIIFHKLSGNKTLLSKLFVLLNELTEHPFTGTGKPEVLKYKYAGLWSRRINHEHRLVYRIDEKIVTVLSARFHYE